MPLNTKLVQLDLNNPEFQKSWVELEAEDAERVRSALKDFEADLARYL